MSKQDKERHYLFSQALMEEPSPVGALETYRDADELHRLNMRLHTLAERSCNGEGWSGRAYTWNEADEARWNKSCENAMAKVKAVFAKYGEFEVEEQGDPRGWGMFEAKSKKSGHVFRVNW